MNLDLDTLREMISSTLQEITTESFESTEPEKDATKKIKDAVEELEQDTKKEDDQLAAEKAAAAAEEDRKEKLSPTPPQPAMESFEITKGRLRQIIAEELISAKKQGIL